MENNQLKAHAVDTIEQILKLAEKITVGQWNVLSQHIDRRNRGQANRLKFQNRSDIILNIIDDIT